MSQLLPFKFAHEFTKDSIYRPMFKIPDEWETLELIDDHWVVEAPNGLRLIISLEEYQQWLKEHQHDTL